MAVLVWISAAALTLIALIHSGVGAFPGVLFFGVMAAIATAARRVGVVASPAGLRVSTGIRTRDVAWDSIQGFWYRRARRNGGVFVLTAGDGLVHLPYAESITPARPDDQQAASAVKALTDYWDGIRPNHEVVDVDAVGATRFEAWRAKSNEEARQTRFARGSRIVMPLVYGVVMMVIGVKGLVSQDSRVGLAFIGLGALGPVLSGFEMRRQRRQ